MAENLTLQRMYANGSDYDRFLVLDREFHWLLFHAVDLTLAYEQLRDGTPLFDRERALSYEGEAPDAIVQDHTDILQAIVKKDRRAVRKAMARHLERVVTDTGKLRKQYPDYYV